jgi:hypothetical protein
MKKMATINNFFCYTYKNQYNKYLMLQFFLLKFNFFRFFSDLHFTAGSDLTKVATGRALADVPVR